MYTGRTYTREIYTSDATATSLQWSQSGVDTDDHHLTSSSILHADCLHSS